MKEAVIALAVILLASSAAIIQWTDDSDADYIYVHFDYLPGGEYFCPAYIGDAIPRENTQAMIDMGTWHHEDGTPWDPDEIVTGPMTIIIDVRPDPIVPDDSNYHEPSYDPQPNEAPPVHDADDPQIDYAAIIVPFAPLFGLLAVMFYLGYRHSK